MMNGIKCDECMTGYRAGDLKNCPKCVGEFCDRCVTKHGC